MIKLLARFIGLIPLTRRRALCCANRSKAVVPASAPTTAAHGPPTIATAPTHETSTNAISVLGWSDRNGIQAAATAAGTNPSGARPHYEQ